MSKTNVAKIGFAGLTHLGITASICSVSLGSGSLGYEVVAFDPDSAAVSRLAKGDLPILEQGLDQRWQEAQGAIHFTSELKDLGSCSLVIVCLDTPTDSENRSDTAPLERLIQAVGKGLSAGATLVIMSQVRAGFSRKILEQLRKLPTGDSLSLYYWVETLVIGNAVNRFLNPERLITGSIDGAAPKGVFADYLTKLNAPIVAMNYESAELTKTAINLYLSASVCFANFISDLCEHYGASMRQVTTALRMDKRVGPSAYIRPSLGIAGGNLERDLVNLGELAREASVPDTFVRTMITLNQNRYEWALQKVKSLVSNPNDKIAFLGIAYKKDTRSIKNSLAIKVMAQLRGKYRISAYDPQALLPQELKDGVEQKPLHETLNGANLAVIITDWDEFIDALDSSAKKLMRSPTVLDCCGIIDPNKATANGFTIISMGEAQC